MEDIVSHWLAKEVGGEPPFFAGDDVTIIGNQVVARGKARPYGSAAALKLPRRRLFSIGLSAGSTAIIIGQAA